MEEINAMYSSKDYKNLMKACENHDKKEIEVWYNQLYMEYGASIIKKEIGTLEQLIASHCN